MARPRDAARPKPAKIGPFAMQPRPAYDEQVARTRVKICGVMSPEDARVACDAGADAVGMIFHPPSKRNISLDCAKQILSVIGPFVMPVGVFVDAQTQTIGDVAAALSVSTVQLHGHESPRQVEELARLNLRIVKAVRIDDSIERELDMWRRVARSTGALIGLTLETASAGAPGGSGVPNNWAAIRDCQNRGLFAGLPPIIVAGGLTSQTVSEIVRTIRPWAVDVSSGVEISPGRKSPDSIRSFIAAVRRADSLDAA